MKKKILLAVGALGVLVMPLIARAAETVGSGSGCCGGCPIC